MDEEPSRRGGARKVSTIRIERAAVLTHELAEEPAIAHTVSGRAARSSRALSAALWGGVGVGGGADGTAAADPERPPPLPLPARGRGCAPAPDPIKRKPYQAIGRSFGSANEEIETQSVKGMTVGNVATLLPRLATPLEENRARLVEGAPLRIAALGDQLLAPRDAAD